MGRSGRRVTAIEALEAYSAEHPESIDELLWWPAKRFERFYAAFAQRKLAEELKQRKLDMISAIHTNPNYDGEKVDKAGHVREIEDQFDEAIESVYTGKSAGEEIDKSNPFFAAIDRGLEWIDNPSAQKRLDAARAQSEPDSEVPHDPDIEVDQA